MPARYWILRALLGLMCVGFAYMWGRAVGRPARPARRGTGVMSWTIRTLVAAAALQWGAGADLFAGLAYGVSAAAWATGFFLSRRPKSPGEDPTREIFPPE